MTDSVERGADDSPERPPSVDWLARSLRDLELPHSVLVSASRAAIADGDPDSARIRALRIKLSLIRSAINATGVLLHTNLGRSPLAFERGARYSTIEFDLNAGGRGSRNSSANTLIALATGAEAALVVNNGAAALLLALAVLSARRPVPVSRGELVEIGGGARIPEILAASGSALIEVGTTNKTRLVDFKRAMADYDDIPLILKVHPSNYQIVGFTESTTVAELSTLGLPVVFDIGSGLLDEDTPWVRGGRPAWLSHEPGVRQAILDGAAVVTFSGDKLLGGPQAGILAGRSDLIARCAEHPLARALRPGGLVLEALQKTMLSYLEQDGDSIPLWRMAAASIESLKERSSSLGVGAPVECQSVMGGGSLPGRDIPSFGVALSGDHRVALLRSDPPVVARVKADRTYFDLRTVDPTDDDALAAAIRQLG